MAGPTPERRSQRDRYPGQGPAQRPDEHACLDQGDARLDELVDFVVQLASGRLGTRLTPSPAADALDAVIVGLNMLGEELQALTGDLEQRVAERTRELAVAREELQRLALYDSLTGLANRILLAERLEQALARATQGAAPPAVLVLDLDGFKAVNDGFGHLVGDQLLVAVAARVRAAVGEGDTVSRLGGDEFAIVVEHAAPDQVLDLATRVQQAVAAAGDTGFVGASIGVCFAVAGQTCETVLGDADTAMYAVKNQARGGVLVFEPAMRHAALTRTRLAEQLRGAIGDRRELSLIYQPIVELATGRVVAAEALLRWQHPTRGLLRPEAFLTVAVDTGLVTALDGWVLDAAATQMARWRSTVLGDEPFAVHVNMSPRGLRVPRFADDVVAVLSRHGVPASDVIVEITEHQMLGDDVASVEAMTALRAAGVRVAIDDFGSGPSSLAYVRRSLVDTIKIDRSLVRGVDGDPQQHQVIAGILTVIDAFGLTAVAEGVQTAGEAAQLSASGCRYGQGQHWSPPRSAAAVMDLWRTTMPP